MVARFFVCPQCGSLEVTEMPVPQVSQWWRCNACGFEGHAFIEAASERDARRVGDAVRGPNHGAPSR